jgi:hypothetical protein
MSIDGDDKKGALFFNYRWLKDFSRQYEGTIAYAQVLKESRLDREFVYLQNSASLSQNLSFYQSSEFDLQAIDHGIRSSTFRMTNTFATVNVTPIQWLSVNLGYDASRSIYLFETMKTLPDTLFDNNLLQGYRVNFSFRLPASLTVGGTATHRSQSGDSRNSRTFSGFGRISNLLQTELNGSVRYESISGMFSDGNDLTVDLTGLSSRSCRYHSAMIAISTHCLARISDISQVRSLSMPPAESRDPSTQSLRLTKSGIRWGTATDSMLSWVFASSSYLPAV